MKARLLAAGILGCAALAAGLFVVKEARPPGMPPGAADPAFKYYTSAHGNSYGAIDRWAHYGMRAERFIAVLAGSGYRCAWHASPGDQSGTGTVRSLVCQKPERWPLARTLSIRAGFDHSAVDRLVWATADSALPEDGSSFSAWLAGVLRQAGLIEPEILEVKGFQAKTVDTVARMVADSLATKGWHESCSGDSHAAHCGQAALDRAASGFPALPKEPVSVGAALDVERAMERLGLAPYAVRGPDNEQEDSLLVRLADRRMWLDFVGMDLSGNTLSASIEIASAGGTPVRLVARLNRDSQAVTLRGAPRRANDDSIVYLLPKSGENATRHSVWLNLPKPQHPGTLDRLAHNLPLVEYAFIAPMVKAILDAADSGPEERLGLYPALRQMEQQAEIIRALQPGRWLPSDHGRRLMADALKDKPVVRAAWMLGTCAAADEPGTLDRGCVDGFAQADPGAVQLVRREIAQQRLLYFMLPEQHPIRIRLKYLADALPTATDDDSTATGR